VHPSGVGECSWDPNERHGSRTPITSQRATYPYSVSHPYSTRPALYYKGFSLFHKTHGIMVCNTPLFHKTHDIMACDFIPVLSDR